MEAMTVKRGIKGRRAGYGIIITRRKENIINR